MSRPRPLRRGRADTRRGWWGPGGLQGPLAALALVACSAGPPAGPDADRGPPTDVARGEPATGPLRVVVVNEVAAAGAPADWIEVVNAGFEPVDLSAFAFVDLEGDVDRAVPFPAVRLAPGERFVQEVGEAGNGFRLGGDEEVWIYRVADGRVSDGVDWSEGASPAGGSYARVPDVTGAFGTVAYATPGLANAAP